LQVLFPHFSFEEINYDQQVEMLEGANDIIGLLKLLASDYTAQYSLMQFFRKLFDTQMISPLFILMVDIVVTQPNIILDLFHLHGLIPKLIDTLVRNLRMLLAQFDSLAAQNQDFSLVHDPFSKFFSLLYLVITRFELMKVKKNRKQFIAQLLDALNDNSDQAETQSRSVVALNSWFSLYLNDFCLNVPNTDLDKMVIDMIDQLNSSTISPSKYSPVDVLLCSGYLVRYYLAVITQKQATSSAVAKTLAYFCQCFGQYAQIAVALQLQTQMAESISIEKYVLYFLLLRFQR
jgi:hypothetical protein